MEPDMPTKLEDLPALQILEITGGDKPRLIGVFTHVKSVKTGLSWLYSDMMRFGES